MLGDEDRSADVESPAVSLQSFQNTTERTAAVKLTTMKEGRIGRGMNKKPNYETTSKIKKRKAFSKMYSPKHSKGFEI